MKLLSTFLLSTAGINCDFSFLFSTFFFLNSKSIYASIPSIRRLLFLFSILIFFTCVDILTAAFSESDIKVALEVHNEFRLAYNVYTNLTWSKNLADVAQRYAETLQCGELQHSSLDGCGENLYWAGGSDQFTVKDGFDSWADEIRKNEGGITGHATQMLWTDTVLVGCGLYTDGCMTLVCNYYPAGNFGDRTYSDVTENCVALSDEPEISITTTCSDLSQALDCSGQGTPPEMGNTQTGTNEEEGFGGGDGAQGEVEKEKETSSDTDTSEKTDTLTLDLFSTILSDLQASLQSSSTTAAADSFPTDTASKTEKNEFSTKWFESLTTTDDIMTETSTTPSSTSSTDRFLLTLDTTQFPVTPTETPEVTPQTSTLAEDVREFNTIIKPPTATKDNKVLSLSSDASDTSDISDEESNGFHVYVNTFNYRLGMIFVLYSFL